MNSAIPRRKHVYAQHIYRKYSTAAGYSFNKQSLNYVNIFFLNKNLKVIIKSHQDHAYIKVDKTHPEYINTYV